MKATQILCSMVAVACLLMACAISDAAVTRVSDSELGYVLGAGCVCNSTTPVQCPEFCSTDKHLKCIPKLGWQSCVEGVKACGKDAECGGWCG